jgi:capsular polysaccharide transport system permease protein
VKAQLISAAKRYPLWAAAFLASLLAAVFWLGVASDRYVSSAHVLVQRTDLVSGAGLDFSSILGAGNPASRSDQLLLRQHLLSVDMLQKLDEQLNLREHYSYPWRDPFTRMWFHDSVMERFHAHYLQRVSVEFDEYSGLLVVQAQAYAPDMAHRITTLLVQEGEQFMNHLGQQLALAQVGFLEGQVTQLSERALQARAAVLNFQNQQGLVSPQGFAESIAAIVARLQGQLADLQTQRASLQAYLVADHPSVVMLNQQIAAVERQIEQEQARLAAPTGRTLNRTVEAFQRLELEATFAQELYQTALTALEKGRIEAVRSLKKVQVLQTPTLPQYPLQPRRLYNTVVFLIVALLLAGVAQLMLAIVRDHTD